MTLKPSERVKNACPTAAGTIVAKFAASSPKSGER